jgi:antitoxin MazE
MITRKLAKIGNSLGFTWPKDALDRFNLREGDAVCIHETAAGLERTPCDPDFERPMKAAHAILRRDGHAVRALAKEAPS